MKTDDQPAVLELRKGQLWRLKRRYVQVVGFVHLVGLESAGVHFRFLESPNDTGERTLTSGIDTLWRYLFSRKGRLIKAGSPT